MEEIWKQSIVKNYLVSNFGNVKHIKFNRQLKLEVDKKKGYLKIKLNRKMYLVHRLVATAFVSNPDNLPIVNHINGIRSDNRADNLEWDTQKGNVHHSKNVTKFSRKISCYLINKLYTENKHMSKEELISLIMSKCS